MSKPPCAQPWRRATSSRWRRSSKTRRSSPQSMRFCCAFQPDLVWEMLAGAAGRPALPCPDAALAWNGAGLNTALRLGSTLRLFGMRAVVDTQSRGEVEARAWWRAVGATNLVHCLGETKVAWPAKGQRTRRLPPEQVAARLAGGVKG